jgi:hypothetical protein
MPSPANETDRDSPGRIKRRWLRRALQALLLFAGLYLAVDLLADMGWRELVSQLRSAQPGLIATICLLLFLRWVVWSSRWNLSLHRAGVRVPAWRPLPTILAAAFVNHVTPSFRIFGGLLRARYVSRPAKEPFSVAYASVLFDQIVAQTVMGALSAIAFVILALELGRFRQALAAGLIVTSLLLLIPLLLRRYRRLRQPSPARPDGAETETLGAGRSLLKLAKGAFVVLEKLVHEPRLTGMAIALSLAYAVLNIAAAWLAFRALGESTSILAVFLAVSVGVTVGALSGTPGGGLTTEAAMVACYDLLGIDRSLALAATVLYRGLHYLLVLSLGAPSLTILEVLHRRGEAADDAPPAPQSRPADRLV